MFDIQHYGSFITAILIFQAVPGAGTIAILDATARNGTRAGMAAVLGTLTGDLLFMLAAVMGLAAIIHAQPLVFQALQWFGGAYLLWLGIGLVRQRHDDTGARPSVAMSWQAYFCRAFMVSVGNPKVMLFFVGFFPLFLAPGSAPTTLVAMMAHVTAFSLLYQTLLVFVGNVVASRLRTKTRAKKWSTRLAGCALIGLSIKLVMDMR